MGKSNIIRRILNYDFQELEATIGVEFAFVDVKDADPNDKDVTLSIQIWDTCRLCFLIYSRSREISRYNYQSHEKRRWSVFSL